MKIILTNVHAHVVDATIQEHQWLDEVTRWPDPGAKFRRWYKGDGYVHPYDQITGVYPAGFMRDVWDRGKKDGVSIKLADKRVKPSHLAADPDLSWLRDYQREAVDSAIKYHRGVWWAPTGSGKTEMAIGLVKSIPCSWLMLCPRIDLAVQAANRFEERTGEKAGLIGDGTWEPSGFTAATFQTFYARLKKGDPEAHRLICSVQGLIIDEVHTLPSSSYMLVSNHAVGAFYRVGMSGTPLSRDDEKSMFVIGCCGPVIYKIPVQQLIDEGQLARPEIEMRTCEQPYKSKKPAINQAARAALWKRVSKELIIESEPRNRMITELVAQSAKPCLVFVDRLEHGGRLEKDIRAAGYIVEFVSGKHTIGQRQGAIKRLENGDIDVLVCTSIFNAGIDIPELRSVVIASAGKSTIATLQRIGRGMRTAGGTKSEFHVYDVYDKGSLLENQSKKRVKAFESEGYAIKRS